MVEVLAPVVHIKARKAPREIRVIAYGKVGVDSAPIPKNPALEVELLHPNVGYRWHPLQLRRLTEVPYHEVGVATPYSTVAGIGTERIVDDSSVDNQLVLK